MLAAIRRENDIAAGRLFQLMNESNSSLLRGDFEKLLTLLERDGWIESKDATFEKDGRSITYRKLSLSKNAEKKSARDLDALKIIPALGATKKGKKRTVKVKKVKRGTQLDGGERGKDSIKEIESLKAWRLSKARQKNIPAFRILTDKALYAICERKPRSQSELLEVAEINRKAAAQFGDDIVRVMRRHQ